MKFSVSMKIDGRFYCEVEAESFEDAKEKAQSKYIDADFGELECIEAECVNAEDEHGRRHDYE